MMEVDIDGNAVLAPNVRRQQILLNRRARRQRQFFDWQGAADRGRRSRFVGRFQD